MSIVKASLLVCVIVFLFTGCNNQTQFKVMQPDETGLHFRNDIITGPGGSQVLLVDP